VAGEEQAAGASFQGAGLVGVGERGAECRDLGVPPEVRAKGHLTEESCHRGGKGAATPRHYRSRLPRSPRARPALCPVLGLLLPIDARRTGGRVV